MWGVAIAFLLLNVVIGVAVVRWFSLDNETTKTERPTLIAANDPWMSTRGHTANAQRRLNDYLETGTLGGLRIRQLFSVENDDIRGIEHSLNVTCHEAQQLAMLLRGIRGILQDCAESYRGVETRGAISPRALSSDATECEAAPSFNVQDVLSDDVEVPNSVRIDGDERISDRVGVAFMVTALPLDETYRIHGQPFASLARDVSSNGISIYHTQKVSARILALELLPFDKPPIYVVVDVRHSSECGPYFVTGAELDRRLCSGPIVDTLRRFRAPHATMPEGV